MCKYTLLSVLFNDTSLSLFAYRDVCIRFLCVVDVVSVVFDLVVV